MTSASADPPKRPGLRSDASVAEALRALAHDMLAEGRAAISDPNRSDAVAVHDFRKAMKRWRAFLRLLQPLLGDEGRRMRTEAADLARSLSGARDARTALDALADLAKGEEALSARSHATIADRLEALRAAAEGVSVTREARANIDAALAADAEAVKFWPLATVGYRAVVNELAAGYRRARDAIPRDWMAVDAEALHDLRKRVVAHRCQMDIIEPLWPRFGQFWVGEAQRLRERLGHCQDLVIFANLTAPHQPLARWRARLVPLIAARRAHHVEVAARIARRLFADSPKAFRRRLLALWDPTPHAARANGQSVPAGAASKPARMTACPPKASESPGRKSRPRKSYASDPNVSNTAPAHPTAPRSAASERSRPHADVRSGGPDVPHSEATRRAPAGAAREVRAGRIAPAAEAKNPRRRGQPPRSGL